MKITKEHFDHMKSEINTYLTSHPDFYQYAKTVQAEGKARDIYTRLRWDCTYGAQLGKWMCDELYTYLNDDHVDTALKRIVTNEMINEWLQ